MVLAQFRLSLCLVELRLSRSDMIHSNKKARPETEAETEAEAAHSASKDDVCAKTGLIGH